MLETGGILIVMGTIFAAGVAGEWILSLFYRRYLRDTADMGRPGKKLVKLTKLRYETSYYLNGTVHNAKTMVEGMLEHYRLAGLRLWTWHHIATTAAFLCGAMGFAIGGAYVVGRYIPEVKEFLPLSGMNALIYTLAGGALSVMLIFWQNFLDNRTKRRRLESNLVDYFDNEKFHQLGREIALSGRVREIAGDRGRREDPGSVAAEEKSADWAESAAAEMLDRAGGMSQEAEKTVAGAVRGRTGKAAAVAKDSGRMAAATAKDPGKKATAGSEKWDALRESGPQISSVEPAEPLDAMSAEGMIAAGMSGGMTIADIISRGELPESPAPEADENAARGRGTRRKTTSASTRTRAKNVQIAQEEMEERKAGGSRRKGKNSRDVIIPLNPESGTAAKEPAATGTTENGMALKVRAESSEEADERDRLAEMEAAATAAAASSAAKRRRPAGKTPAASMGTGETVGNGVENGADDPSGNLYAATDRASREEELLRLLREYMGL